MLVNTLVLFSSGVAFVALAALLVQLSFLHIADVRVVGTRALDEQEIRGHVQEHIDGAYMWVFPKRHSLYYPDKKIRADLLSMYPRIKSLDFDVIGATSLHVQVTEREPYALWCGHVLSTTSPASAAPDCYFADDGGYLFSRAPYISDNEFFKIYGTPQQVSINTRTSVTLSLDDDVLQSEVAHDYSMIGTQYLPEDVFVRVMKFVSVLKAEGIDSESLEVLGVQGTLHLLTGGSVLFNIDQDLSIALADLVLAHTKKLADGQEVHELEYIDVRFDNKVLFKYVDAVVDEVVDEGTEEE
jgi:hypothetical protein